MNIRCKENQRVRTGDEGQEAEGRLLDFRTSAFPRATRAEVRTVLVGIHSDPSRGWTVSELAELACLSPSALYRAFVRDVGLTPMAWLGHIRVAEVARLLWETGDSVQVIARLVGWENRGHATRQFKMRMGMTPSQYRSARNHASGRTCLLCGRELLACTAMECAE